MSTSSPEILNPAAEAMSSAARSAKTVTDKASAGIRNRVSQTCEQFTDSMDAVAQKLDVPAGIKDKWHATKDTAQAAIGQATRHLHEGKKAVQDKTTAVAHQAKSLSNQAAAQVPAPAAGRVTGLAQALRQRPAPVAAIVFAIFALLLLRRLLSQTAADSGQIRQEIHCENDHHHYAGHRTEHHHAGAQHPVGQRRAVPVEDAGETLLDMDPVVELAQQGIVVLQGLQVVRGLGDKRAGLGYQRGDRGGEESADRAKQRQEYQRDRGPPRQPPPSHKRHRGFQADG